MHAMEVEDDFEGVPYPLTESQVKKAAGSGWQRSSTGSSAGTHRRINGLDQTDYIDPKSKDYPFHLLNRKGGF